MRRKIFVCLGLALFICLTALTIGAQEQEAQLYFVRLVKVKPSKAANYFEGAKELMTQLKEHKYPYSINVFRCNDFTTVYTVPLKDLADLQTLGDSMNALMASIAPETGQKIQKFMGGAVEYQEDGLIVFRPDLSYIPESPRLNQEEINFQNWTFTYILPGMEKDLEEMSKKYKALYQAKNIPDGFMLYQVIMGKQQPMYILVQSAKNTGDYFSTDHSEVLGEEGAEKGPDIGLVVDDENRGGHRMLLTVRFPAVRSRTADFVFCHGLLDPGHFPPSVSARPPIPTTWVGVVPVPPDGCAGRRA